LKISLMMSRIARRGFPFPLGTGIFIRTRKSLGGDARKISSGGGEGGGCGNGWELWDKRIDVGSRCGGCSRGGRDWGKGCSRIMLGNLIGWSGSGSYSRGGLTERG
jgi:hypothetical protein